MSDTKVKLDDRQTAFIEKFLLKRKSGPFKGGKNRDIDQTNEATRGAYADYDALERQFVTETTGLAEWQDTWTAGLAAAIEDKNAGAFDTAGQKMTTLLGDVRDLKDGIRQRRNTAKQSVDDFALPAWASVDAGGEMTRLAQAAGAALTLDVPSKTNLEAGEDGVRQLTALASRAEQAVRDRRTALQNRLDTQLLVPDWASDTALTQLQDARRAAEAAIQAEVPTPADFTTAETKASEFERLVTSGEQAVRDRRADLQNRLDTALVVPAWVPADALTPLQDARNAVEAAIRSELPLAADFTTADSQASEFERLVTSGEQAVRERRANLQNRLDTALVIPAWVPADALTPLQDARNAVEAAIRPELPLAADFTTADTKATEFERLLTSAEQAVRDLRATWQTRLTTKLVIPDWVTAPTLTQLQDARNAVEAAVLAALPTPANFTTADTKAAEFDKLFARIGKADDAARGMIAAGRPQCAAKLREATATLSNKLGGVETTDQSLTDARQVTANKASARQLSIDAWQAANSLPTGTPEQALLQQAEVTRTADAYFAADAEWQTARERERLLDGDLTLSRMAAGGPLSADSKRFSDGTAAAFIDCLGKNPGLGAKAVQSAMRASQPDAIAAALPDMARRAGNKFAAMNGKTLSQDKADAYAENLLDMTGQVGGGFLDGFDAYVGAGNHLKADPIRAPGGSWEQLCQGRSVYVANALLKSDGSGAIDLDAPTAKTAIGDAMFHPDAVRNPTPALNNKMLATLGAMRGKITEVNDTLADCTAPGTGVAQEFVGKALGKPATGALGAQDTRSAVLAAALKPTYQGPVGSCFATAPIRKVGETDVVTELGYLGQVASKGTLQLPGSPVPIPAISRLPANDDPLKRSLEYTAATAMARQAASAERSALKGAMDGGFGKLTEAGDVRDLIVGSKTGMAADLEVQLKTAQLKRIAQKFTFNYDPLVETEVAADGSSSRGRFVLSEVPGGEAITSREKFAERVGELVILELGVTDEGAKTKVRDAVKGDAFLKSVSPDPTPTNKTPYKPWELSGGGDTEAAYKTVFGATAAQDTMLDPVPTGTTVDEGERSKAVLTAMLGKIGGSAEKMVTMRTQGIHAFNGLPTDPAMIRLAAGGDIAGNIDRQLLQPGQDIANADLPAERAAWLFDERIRAAVDAEKDDGKKGALKLAAAGHRPTGAMKPSLVADAVDAALDAYQETVAGEKAADWASKATTPPDASAIEAKKVALKKGLKDASSNAAKSLMIQELGAPTVTIADTNWGSNLDHTFFVMAPDPTTGKLLLWQRQDPPGSFSPAGEKWVKAKWASVQ